MRLIVLMLACVVCLGCEQAVKVEESQGTDEISYRWDARHRLCFAMIGSVTHSGYRVISITHVPLIQEQCE